MADNIKKVIIPYTQLPAIYNNNFTYNVRYRVISEDRNRFSAWSRIYSIDASKNVNGDPLINPHTYSYVKETVNTNSGTTTAIRLSWKLQSGVTVPTSPTFYDVFVKRGAGGFWQYLDTTTAQTYTVVRSAGLETEITIAVQSPTFPKERLTESELFVTSAIPLP